MEPEPPPVRAARRLRTAVVVLLLGDAAAAWVVVLGVYTLLQRVWLGLAGRVGAAEIETHVAQVQFARRFQVLLALATVVVFLLWLRRAHRNLRMLGVERLGFSPRAALAAFLVHVLNFVVPVRVVSELWRASRPETDRGPRWWEVRGPLLVAVWWALVVASSLADPLWWDISGGVDMLAIGGSTFLFIVAQLGRLAASLLTVAIVWTIDAEQARHFAVLER